MTLKGRVVNLLPSLQPNRAIVRIENWDDSFTVPLGDLKLGQHVSIEVLPVLVSGAAAGSSQRPRS